MDSVNHMLVCGYMILVSIMYKKDVFFASIGVFIFEV